MRIIYQTIAKKPQNHNFKIYQRIYLKFTACDICYLIESQYCISLCIYSQVFGNMNSMAPARPMRRLFFIHVVLNITQSEDYVILKVTQDTTTLEAIQQVTHVSSCSILAVFTFVHVFQHDAGFVKYLAPRSRTCADMCVQNNTCKAEKTTVFLVGLYDIILLNSDIEKGQKVTRFAWKRFVNNQALRRLSAAFFRCRNCLTDDQRLVGRLRNASQPVDRPPRLNFSV